MKRERETRYQVWARALWAYLDLAALARVPVDSAFEGMPFDEKTLRSRSNVEWDDFCIVTERLEELCGGPERCRQLLEQSYHEVLPEFRSLMGSVTCPVSFARLAVGVISPIIYQGCAFSVADAGRHRLHIQLRLRQGARSSLTFFRATVGELQALPRHLGLGHAAVRADFSSTQGDYDVLLPPLPYVTDRVLDAVRLPDVALGVTRSGEGHSSSVDGSTRADVDTRLVAMRAIWSLTARQSEVLRHVVEGASNKEIAERLDCAENTVELHMTRLLQKAGLSSRARLIAQFWGGI
jgi:DNA-binding CsgD family transcriptional regulator